jgi:LCP family protein required for cell wall assembly
MRPKIDLARIAAVLVVIAAIAYFYTNILSPTLIHKSLRPAVIRKPLNILILGTDITYDRITKKPMPDRKGRADTILLAHVDPIKYKISMLSIPRDTLVDIPDYGKQKINFAYAWGGLSLTRQIVSDITQKKIDYYVEVKPTAVTKLIDVLGGVTLFVEHDMRYQDRAQGLNINLKKGWQKLSGKQAHDYIRYRDNLRGDIVRIEHQQSFLKATAKELTKPSNVLKAPFAISAALREIKTNMPPSKIIRLLNLARMFSVDDIHTVMVPGDVTMEAKVGSVWVMDELALQKTLTQHF